MSTLKDIISDIKSLSKSDLANAILSDRISGAHGCKP